MFSVLPLNCATFENDVCISRLTMYWSRLVGLWATTKLSGARGVSYTVIGMVQSGVCVCTAETESAAADAGR